MADEREPTGGGGPPARWVAAILVGAALVAVGLPAIGVGAFHASDALKAVAPWREAAPPGFHPANPLVTDTVDATTPFRLEYRRRAHRGDFPLWSPYAAGGAPLGALPNASTLSPLTVPWLVVPAWYAPALAKLLELLVAAGGMVLFLRRLGVGRPGALVGALAFVLSGFQVVWTNWPQSHVGALIPGLFWAVERAVQRGRWWDGWPVAVVSAVMWLEGFPALAAWAHLAAGAYALVRVVAAHPVGGTAHQTAGGGDAGGPLTPEPARSAATPRRPAPGARLSGTASGALARLRQTALSGGPLLGAARRALPLGGWLALGLGLAAVQLLPFLTRLGELELTYRAEKLGGALPWQALATLVVPDAFGSPADRVYFGPAHYVELQSFLGITALLLVAVSAAWAGRLALPRGVRGFLWSALAVAGTLTYLGGPPLEVLQEVPLLGTNRIGRMRGLVGFLLAALAGVGFSALVQGSRSGWPHRRVAAAAGVGLAGVAVALGGAAGVADQAGRAGVLARQAVLPGAVGVLAVAALVVVLAAPRRRRGLVAASDDQHRHRTAHHRRPARAGSVAPDASPDNEGPRAPRQRSGAAAGGADRQRLTVGRLALLALPLLLAVEAVAFARPFWPRIPAADFYPTTPAHRFLAERLGHDRFAAAGTAMMAGTAPAYALRSVTGHTLTPPAYADLLRRVDPEVFAESRTVPRLDATAAVAASPILDRLAARYFVAAPTAPVIGAPETVTRAAATRGVTAGEGLAAPLPAGPLRAVRLSLGDAVHPTVATHLDVTVRDAAGAVVATGRRRIHRGTGPGEFDVAVTPTGGAWRADGDRPARSDPSRAAQGSGPGTSKDQRARAAGQVPTRDGLRARPAAGRPAGRSAGADTRRRWTVTATVEAEEGALPLATDGAGRLAVTAIRPADDGLEVAFTGGVVIYARTRALPRIRWASATGAPAGSVEALAGGLPPDTVQVDGPPAGGGGADLEILEDSGDAVRVAVTAETAGYLVVADSLGDGWGATVDGEPARLRPADHALAAVRVPAGQHRVALTYRPAGWRAGQAISLLVLLALGLAALRARRAGPPPHRRDRSRPPGARSPTAARR